MKDSIETGVFRGTGAAINISLGYVPDFVMIANHTDGDKIWMGHPKQRIMPFSGGGTNPTVAGDTIVGATSGARAIVTEVVLDSGSFAGGDAAGWFILDEESKTGTFGSENVYVLGDGGADDATVTVDVTSTQDIDTEVASATGNNGVTAYLGAAGTAAKGFTVGSTIAEDAKLFVFTAGRSSRFVNANSL